MTEGLTEEELRGEIERLSPFYHRVELPFGISTHSSGKFRRGPESDRVKSLVKHAFPALMDACGGSLTGRRVLDVACNCGGFSVEAVQRECEYVLGVDIVDRYIEQAQFIKRALGIEHAEFKVMDIESCEEATVGLFDVTFCFGILYHLENPVRTMKQLAALTKSAMLVDTSLMRMPPDIGSISQKPLWLMDFPLVSSQESRDRTTSLWRSGRETVQFRPNEAAVLDLLKIVGFAKVEKIAPLLRGLEKRYYTGHRAAFLAVRS